MFSGNRVLTGVDVGASAIKIISGTRKKTTFQVERLVIIPLPYRSIDERGIVNAEIVSEAVRTGLAELGGKKPQIATAVRGGGVLTKRIVIPKIPLKEIPDQVKWEAEQVFPQDITSILVDHVLLGEGKNVPGAPPDTPGWDILLVGVRQEEAQGLEAVIEGAGGQLKYMDLDSFATADFLEELIDVPDHEAVAFVDIGASATRVAIRHNKHVVFIREFYIGGNAFTEAIASALGLSFENAESLKLQQDSGIPQEAMEALQGVFLQWKNELQQCEDIFVTQNASTLVSRWYIFGGAAQTPGLFEILRDERFGEKALPLPTQQFFETKGKGIDGALLASWSGRLFTAAALCDRKG